MKEVMLSLMVAGVTATTGKDNHTTTSSSGRSEDGEHTMPMLNVILMMRLDEYGDDTRTWATPVEVASPVRVGEDTCP